MNIFVLDQNPKLAAKYHADIHVVKMILETAQILCTVIQESKGTLIDGLYKPTHKNHPCVKWAAEKYNNFRWLLDLGFALCEEYIRRYHKIHKTEAVIQKCEVVYLGLEFTHSSIPPEFIFCGPDHYKTLPVVEAYRQYYKIEKREAMNLKWTNRPIPQWMVTNEMTKRHLK